MSIYRWNGFSLVDSPDQSAAVVFCKGCKLTCRYCYNTVLRTFIQEEGDLSFKTIMSNIKALRRSNVQTVEWLIISGGDPMFADKYELQYMIDEAKKLDLKVGIYTSGCNPEKLAYLKDIDYYHIDYKGPIMMTEESIDAATLQSINALDKSKKIHVSTTVLKSVHTLNVLRVMQTKLNVYLGSVPVYLKGETITTDVAWILNPAMNGKTLDRLLNQEFYLSNELPALKEALNRFR